MNSKIISLIVILILIFIYSANSNTIVCNSGTPDSYTIAEIESPCKYNDPESKWACANGFELHNTCKNGSYFLKNEKEIFNNKKVIITYSANTYPADNPVNFLGNVNYSFSKTFKINNQGYDELYESNVSVDTAHICDNPTSFLPKTKAFCEKIKEKTETYLYGYLNSAIRKMKNNFSTNTASNENNERNISVTVSKKGFKSVTEPFTINKDKTGEIIINGVVKSSEGYPIPNALVLLDDFNLKTKTDQNGKYVLKYVFNKNINETVLFNHDFILNGNLGQIEVNAVYDKLIANGKHYSIKIYLKKDSNPLKNKKISVYIPPDSFEKNGKKVNYLTNTPNFNKVKTNEYGMAVIDVIMPKTIKSKLNNIARPENYFPVSATLKIKLLDTNGQGETKITINGPFPKIEKFLIPGNLDAGLWQTIPSKVIINDPDSNEFKIEIRGAGRFKVKQGKIYQNGLIGYLKDKNIFEFYYSSENIGLDLNNQPDILKELTETNIKVAMSFLVSFSEEWALDKAATLSIFNKKVKGTGEFLKNVEKASKLGIGLFDYTMQSYNYINKNKLSTMEKADWAITGIGLLNDLLNDSLNATINISSKVKNVGGLESTLYLEIAKALYENSKTFYSIYKKYRKVADAYQGVVFIPIAVYVTDNDGYTTKAMRGCSVKIWQSVN
jgi:hypothetical protein